jgi:hypothetical protein
MHPYIKVLYCYFFFFFLFFFTAHSMNRFRTLMVIVIVLLIFLSLAYTSFVNNAPQIMENTHNSEDIIQMKNAKMECENECTRTTDGDKITRTCTQTCQPVRNQKWTSYF